MKKKTLIQWVTILVTTTLMPCYMAFSQPEGLLLWNTMDSQEDVINSRFGPNILLTSYKVPHWTEASIEEAKYGNGLFINHGMNYSISDGANFFVLDNLAMGLSPERGTIEFWFKFYYDCTTHNTAYMFIMEDVLTDHYYSGYPARPATRFFSAWSGWNYPDRKNYLFYVHNNNDGVNVQANTPAGSTLPGNDLEFFTGQLTHFAFVWDLNGIDGSDQKIQIYVDGELKGSSVLPWTTTGGILNYTYLGSTPNINPWDNHYNALYGVMDNLKVWNYAKTYFDDREFEGFITCPEDITIECDASIDPSATGEPEVVVNCEGGVNITYNDYITAGTCGNEYTIQRIWTVEDACGNMTSCTQVINVVDNIPPMITGIPTGPKIVQNDPGICGAMANYAFIGATDICGGATTLTFDPVEGTFLPVGITEVMVTAVDVCGNSISKPFDIQIINAPPEILSISAPLDPTEAGINIETGALYFDTNIDAAEWNWGDGNVSEGVIEETTVLGDHTYALPGVYTLTLTLTDICEAQSAMEYSYVVIYNPDGGFVTGHGWIESPPGAYFQDPLLMGRANFGFTSKYQKGTTIPTGNTKFKFKVADLKFESYVYDWLVVAGDKAKFKGEGTINDSGLYGFMISAIDGDNKAEPDKFRIKIWDKVTDMIVYDNQLDADENTDPTTEIGAGTITVHDGKDTNIRTSSNSNEFLNGDQQDDISIYPNPASNIIYVQLSEDLTREKESLNIQLFNITGVDVISNRRQILSNNVIEIDVEDIPSGIYILMIPNGVRTFKYKLTKL